MRQKPSFLEALGGPLCNCFPRWSHRMQSVAGKRTLEKSERKSRCSPLSTHLFKQNLGAVLGTLDCAGHRRNSQRFSVVSERRCKQKQGERHNTVGEALWLPPCPGMLCFLFQSVLVLSTMVLSACNPSTPPYPGISQSSHSE